MVQHELMDILINELSVFTMLPNGKMESLWKHDDTVIALALAVQATKEYKDSIAVLDGSEVDKAIRMGGRMKSEWNPLLTDMGDVIVKLMPQQDMASKRLLKKPKNWKRPSVKRQTPNRNHKRNQCPLSPPRVHKSKASQATKNAGMPTSNRLYCSKEWR